MLPILQAVAPVFLLIMLGLLIRQRRWVPEALWAPAERMTYFCFFPALIITSLAGADLSAVPVGTMAIALVSGTLGALALLFVLRPALGLSNASFTSVFQGSTRPNTYVGIAAAVALYGPPGATLTAVGIASIVPLVNVMAVLALSRWGDGRDPSWRGMALGIAKNPLIIAVIIGGVLNQASIGDWHIWPIPVLSPLLEILGKASLPVGLLAVGAGLDLEAARIGGRGLIGATVLKLAVLPAIATPVAWALGLNGLELILVAIYASLPCSASSFVLARQMGGDYRLMAGIITAQTLAAVVTMPIVMIIVT